MYLKREFICSQLLVSRVGEELAALDVTMEDFGVAASPETSQKPFNPQKL